MLSGGSPAIQCRGGILAPIVLDLPTAEPRTGRRYPSPMCSTAAKSPDSSCVYLAKGSPASQIRGGGPFSPAKLPSSRAAQMNNGVTSTTDPGGVVRAPTAMGFISNGEIKLLEEFVTFCMSKRVSSRADCLDNKGSNGDYSLKSKLLGSFGHVLNEQAINGIFYVVHESNQSMCSLCKSSSQSLVFSVLEIACQSMIKKHENFSREDNMLACDGKHSLNVGECIEPKQSNPIISAKEQGYQSVVGKESTVIDIEDVCKSNFPPVDTPAVKKSLVNPGITDIRKSAAARLIKKRIHSKLHKDIAIPKANLFAPDHTCKGEPGESVGSS